MFVFLSQTKANSLHESEAVDELLKLLRGVSVQSCIICKGHHAYIKILSHFGVGTIAGQVEETAIASGV